MDKSLRAEVQMKMVIRIACVVVCVLIGLSVGMDYGGNYADDFEFIGLRGYEATGALGAIIGAIAGATMSALFRRSQ